MMNAKKIAKIAMIAALYTVISLALQPLTYGQFQVRIAEAFTLLPLITPLGIPGVTLGCFLTNLLGAMLGVNPTGYLDAIFGTLATLLAALATYQLRNKTIKKIPVLAIMMPVLFNGVIIGMELAALYFPNQFIQGSIICGFEVAVGELISVIVGWFIIKALKKTSIFEK